MKEFKNKIPEGFTTPNSLPKSKEEARAWQEKNYKWWNENPMRYDWKEKIEFPEFTKEFYLEIDKRFFKNAAEYLDKNKNIPFDEFIDFKSLKNKDVLEIGVGNGSHAQLLAEYSKKFTGIDITDYAVKSTKQRMTIFGLKAEIIKMDAEKLNFSDNIFDFIWSWGVIHHSSNTELILKEINRVLRPGGKAVIMVYYRGWWNYYIKGIILGVINGYFLRGKSIHEITQIHTDGAIARYYGTNEWRILVHDIFRINYIKTLGAKSDFVLLPAGIVKKLIQGLIPNKINRFLTYRFRMGSFLISELEKQK